MYRLIGKLSGFRAQIQHKCIQSKPVPSNHFFTASKSPALNHKKQVRTRLLSKLQDWQPHLFQVKAFKQEYNAVVALVCRSFNLTRNDIAAALRQFQKQSEQENKKKEDGKPPKEASSSTSGDDPQKGSEEGGDENKGNDEKMKAVMMKILSWIFSIYMLMFFLSILFSPRDRNPETSTRYVSWNEFVYHMLAAGEVKELIIRPDMEMVTIILHEGAIIRGRRAISNVFHMSVADANTFEEKLKEVEKKLNITENVPITYDRQSGDFVGRILTLLLIFAVVMSITSRMKGFKSPISMDSFVSFTLCYTLYLSDGEETWEVVSGGQFHNSGLFSK